MSRPLPAFLPPLLDPQGGRRRPATTSPGRALKPPPLPTLTAVRTRAAAFGFTQVSRQGRIIVTDVASALGWSTDSRLAARILNQTVVIGPAESGSVAFRQPWRVWLPAAICRRLDLSAGTGVLLAADPTSGDLTVYPPVVLDHMIARLREADTP